MGREEGGGFRMKHILPSNISLRFIIDNNNVTAGSGHLTRDVRAS